MGDLLCFAFRFSTSCCSLSSDFAPLAYKRLVFVAPEFNIAACQGQDNASIIDSIVVVAACLAEATIAQDGKLVLFRPAFALGCRAAKQCFEFPGRDS